MKITYVETIEERAFCARRFGIDYCIFGPTEQECRELMERELGRAWKWLRLLGWRVSSFTVPRHVYNIEQEPT